jgi:tetraacyldisaccharide 4'-kinase
MSDPSMLAVDRRGAFERWLLGVWYGSSVWRFVLFPFSLVYALLVASRRAAYRLGLRRATRGPQPVVVVGNLTVGGSGKTPLVIWLVEALAERGLRAAVVSRGYGGTVGELPLRVDQDTDPALCGDEPLLIARRTGALVVVHPDRVLALMSLGPDAADVIIADDGLQHLSMAREYEIVVVDGSRRLGNGMLLPAGPLREPAGRLSSVDALVTNVTRSGDASGLRMRLEPTAFVRPLDGTREPVASWVGRRVGALAGIGDPSRFFDTLNALGVEVAEVRALSDHAELGPQELGFSDLDRVVMTEKDAVRAGVRLSSHHWYLEVSAAVYDGPEAEAMLVDLVRSLTPGPSQETR